MDGRPRIEGTNIVFDYFGLREEGYKYFLSHAHMDHLRGLDDGWDWGEIYCSHETKAIVAKKWPSVKPYLQGRDMEESFDVVLDAGGQVAVQVRMLDAHHCLGSAVFVLDGFFGRAVYTGDFRVERETLEHEIWSENRPVDYLFLDNTLHASSMPHVDRAHWREMLCDLVRFYPPHVRFEVGIESLGKEEALEAMAKALETKVQVSRERFEVIRDISEFDVSCFVHRAEDRAQARIKVVPRTAINERRVLELNAHPEDFVVCILLQASGPAQRRQVRFQGPFPPETLQIDDRVRLRRLALASKPLDDLYKRRFFIVPYTLHASRYELANFVRVLRPHKIVGIVSRERKGDLLDYITRWQGCPSDDHLARLRRQWSEYKDAVTRQASDASRAHNEVRQRRDDLARLITKAHASRKHYDSVLALRPKRRRFCTSKDEDDDKADRVNSTCVHDRSDIENTGLAENSPPDAASSPNAKASRPLHLGANAKTVATPATGGGKPCPSAHQVLDSDDEVEKEETGDDDGALVWTKQMDITARGVGKLRRKIESGNWTSVDERAERMLLALIGRTSEECVARCQVLAAEAARAKPAPGGKDGEGSDDDEEGEAAGMLRRKRFKKTRKRPQHRAREANPS